MDKVEDNSKTLMQIFLQKDFAVYAPAECHMPVLIHQTHFT